MNTPEIETKTISSTNNEKIKQLAKLSKKNEREKTNQFIVENTKIIIDAISAGLYPKSVFITENLLNSGNDNIEHLKKSINSFFLIDEKINKHFSSLATPSGICAIFEINKSLPKLNNKILYLNGVSDPGNLGTILRSALAFDFNNIIIDEWSADLYNPKTINAAKDAIFKLNITKDKDLEIFNQIKEKMSIYSTNLENGEEISQIETNKNFCLVLGNEANGVSENILKNSNKYILIKTTEKIESLNVAIAGAIIMHTIFTDK